MVIRHSFLWMGTLLVLTGLMPAPAQANPWTFEAPRSVKPNHNATLKVTPHVVLKALELKLVNEAGKTVARKTWKSPRKNQPLTIRWTPPVGQSDWSARCIGTYEDGRQTSAFKFRIISIGPLKVGVRKQDVDFSKGSLFLTSNQGLTRADLEGFDSAGASVFDERVELGGRSGRLEIKFPADSKTELKKLELKVYDLANQWTSFRFVNWYLEIEQDQVVFESGKWDLRPAEAKKIDPVVKRIDSEIQRYRTELGSDRANLDGLKLYVAGCTDTVGSHTDNLRLSKNRARSIARYLRSKRVKAEIFYEGFGESLLAVPTADNVPEAKNRRAIYILTPGEPKGLSRKGSRWHRL